MCITLSVKLGARLEQSRHCPGVNGRMAVSGESIDSSKDVGVESVFGLDDRLIGKVDSGVVVVEVVAVVVTSICIDEVEVVAILNRVELKPCDCAQALMFLSPIID